MPLIQSPRDREDEERSYASPQSRLSAIIQASSVSSSGRRLPTGNNRRETLDDLEKDERFMQDAELLLNYLGESDDIFETLRDSDYNIYKGVRRAVESKDWPEEVKQAYARLRTRFDNADTGSFNQWMKAVKDIGIDVVTDPLTIITAALSPFTGGASLGARQAVSQGIQRGAKRYALSRTTALGAADGAIWTGVDDWARQKTEESVGLTDSINGTQILATAAIGGVAGGLIGRLVDGRAINQTARNLSEQTVDEQSRILFGERAISSAIASTLGKPATFLDPYTKVSPTAKRLQQLFRYDLQRNYRPDDPKIREVAGPDFYKNFNNTAGDYLTRIKEIVTPLTFNRRGVKMTSEMNDDLIKAIRTGESDDETVKKAAQGIREVLDEMKAKQVEAGLIADNDFVNYFPRIWNREAIAKNEDVFKDLLIREGEAEDLAEASKITEALLDKKNEILASGAPVAGGSHLAPRRFLNISDDNVFSEFLDNDVLGVLHSYTLQTSKNLAKVETFGVRNLTEFRDKWLNPIIQEAKKNGTELNRSQRQKIVDLYKYTTGEGLEYFDGKIGTFKDYTALAYQVSLLPLATLSSLTEVVLPLTRVSVPSYMKGLMQGAGAGFKKITIDLLDSLKVKHNMTTPQVFKELNRFMIALDQGLADGVERLAGEALRGTRARRWQNTFFKANLLTQWTQMVQATSYITGKDLITSNLKDIHKAKNRNSRSVMRKINELHDLGVDYKEGLRWLERGARDTDDFYHNIQQGAATFVNEIILPTSKEAGTKPHIMSNPKTDILFQFLGYPAAFTNVVMKNMGRQMVDSPIRAPMKIFTGGYIMTEMARWGNWVRSHGESERDKTPGEARLEGIYRWGGNGLILDMMRRSQEMMEATGSVVGAAGGFMGPLPGEVITSIAYRKGAAQIVGSKIPGYGAGYSIFGKEAMDDYNSSLRAVDKRISDIITGRERKRTGYATGGLVEVPNAPREPDRRIDKMTGRPYADQAGDVVSDPLERLLPRREKFSEGGTVSSKPTVKVSPRSPIVNALRNSIFRSN